MPSITPTTLLVAGSITCTLSPALLVWMIRTFLLVPSPAALRHSVPRKSAATRATHRRIVCLFIMIVSLSVGACGLSHHPVAERLPLGIVLRLEVLAAVVVEVAARCFGERVDEQLALQAARHHDAPNHIEILPRLFVGPRRRARVERLQPQRRALAVAGDTPCVTRSLLQKYGLDLGLEVLVVQRRTGGGRRRFLPEHARDQQCPAAESDKRDGLIHAPSFSQGANYAPHSCFGAPSNDEPAKSFRPSAMLTLTALTRREPSLARYPSTLITSAGLSDVRVQLLRTRLVPLASSNSQLATAPV